MIHPFRDSNGRMARCLQSLVLARVKVLSPVFMSVEEYLGLNTQAYYDILAKVGGGSWPPQRGSRPWLRFNLTAAAPGVVPGRPHNRQVECPPIADPSRRPAGFVGQRLQELLDFTVLGPRRAR